MPLIIFFRINLILTLKAEAESLLLIILVLAFLHLIGIWRPLNAIYSFFVKIQFLMLARIGLICKAFSRNICFYFKWRFQALKCTWYQLNSFIFIHAILIHAKSSFYLFFYSLKIYPIALFCLLIYRFIWDICIESLNYRCA